MKQTDFERLKAVCEKEGFDISTYRESDQNGTLIHIKPKERVKVKNSGMAYENDDHCEISFYFDLSINNEILDKGLKKTSEFLACKLYEFLNKE